MTSRSRGRPRHPDVLTPTEWTVLDLYRHGLSRRGIAELRGTSQYAVRYHLRNTAEKLGVAEIRDLRHWPGFPATSAMKTNTRRRRRFKHMDDVLALGPLGQVSMFCRDAQRTEVWYREVLGLKHVFTFGELVFFDCGGTRLYFRQVPEGEWRKSSILYFLVPEIDVARDQLAERGVSFLGAPHMIYRDEASGVEEWMAFFDDPDGNTLAIMSRVSPS